MTEHLDREYVNNGTICDTIGGYTYEHIYYIMKDNIRHYYSYCTGVRTWCNPTLENPEYMYEDRLSQFPIEMCDVLRVFYNAGIKIEEKCNKIMYFEGIQCNPFTIIKFNTTEELQKIVTSKELNLKTVYPYKLYKPNDTVPLYSPGWGDGTFVTDKYIFQGITDA